MKIVIVNCHWDNRGDEAAIRAMIDEMHLYYPEAMIYVQRALGEFVCFPENSYTRALPAFPIGGKKNWIQEKISYLSKGRINLTKGAREFYKAILGSAMVIHAPGGPSIGDIYLTQEKLKLRRLLAVKRTGTPYAFYAPSMGPFEDKKRNPIRKKILENATFFSLREDISRRLVEDFIPSIKPIVTLDSAFQHPIDLEYNKKIYQSYSELNEFIGDGKNVIGVTITDLQWNSLYRGDGKTKDNIRLVFTKFIKYITKKRFKVLFIPQLFERANDYNYMSSFAEDGCYVMSDKYDCYFQQFVIKHIKAVIGMRYHSNIFSAKMGTPFISVSYEQKMVGFMQKAGLMEYCIGVEDLTFELLQERFDKMLVNYSLYKDMLMNKKEEFRKESYRTTELLCKVIDKNINIETRS